jgi:large subunit ribosomal protein L21
LGLAETDECWVNSWELFRVYAIIEDGSHQYRVQEGDTLEVQRRDLEEGQTSVEFDKVVMLGDGADARIGQPYVDGSHVTASVVNEIKGPKIHIIKYRRRKDSKTKIGHRQKYLRVRIDKIHA